MTPRYFLTLILYSVIAGSVLAQTAPGAAKTDSLAEIAAPLRTYLRFVSDDIKQRPFPDRSWNHGASEEEGYPPGGIVEWVVLPVHGKEKMLLLRASLDSEVASQELSAPQHESFWLVWSDAQGRWQTIFEWDQKFFGRIDGRRMRNGRLEYCVRSKTAFERAKVEFYTVEKGQLKVRLALTLPSNTESKIINDEQGEKGMEALRARLDSAQKGVEPFEAVHGCIFLADLIGQSEPAGRVHDFRSFDLEREGKTVRKATLKEFQAWLEK